MPSTGACLPCRRCHMRRRMHAAGGNPACRRREWAVTPMEQRPGGELQLQVGDRQQGGSGGNFCGTALFAGWPAACRRPHPQRGAGGLQAAAPRDWAAGAGERRAGQARRCCGRGALYRAAAEPRRVQVGAWGGRGGAQQRAGGLAGWTPPSQRLMCSLVPAPVRAPAGTRTSAWWTWASAARPAGGAPATPRTTFCGCTRSWRAAPPCAARWRP